MVFCFFLFSQLLFIMHHPSDLSSVDSTTLRKGKMFTGHFNKGAVQAVKVWNLSCKEGTLIEHSLQ